MNTKDTPSIDAKKPQPKLDDTDKKILQTLQEDFPLIEHPWTALSSKLGIPEQELLTRIETLSSKGVIQKIGPVIDALKMGYASATLVALRVPKDKVDNVAAVINQYSNISHNYEREHEYNVWFTLTAQNNTELTGTIKEITQKIGLKRSDVLNLPTLKRFKINVNFQLTPQF